MNALDRLEARFAEREPEVRAFLPEEGRFERLRREREELRARWPDPVEDQTFDTSVSNDPGPDEELHQQRLHDALVKAMDELSSDHRAVVDLTYFHGMGYREIADIMNCPVDTVKTRMFHARRRLKAAMPGSLFDWL